MCDRLAQPTKKRARRSRMVSSGDGRMSCRPPFTTDSVGELTCQQASASHVSCPNVRSRPRRCIVSPSRVPN